jgi:hypothetical protein
MVYKVSEIRKNTLQVQVKVNETGSYNLFITLTHKHHTEQVFRLQPIKIEVKDAPLYLLGSQFCYPDVGVAGEEIRLEIFPVDVFGCPLHAGSTTDYNLTGFILSSAVEPDGTKEMMDFSIVKEKPNIKLCVSLVLNKAGRRKLMIFGSKKKSKKKLKIHIRPNLNYVHFEQAAPKVTSYATEELSLTALVFDRFNNEIQIDALQSIPDLEVKNGSDALVCTSKSVKNNEVTFQCHFTCSGKYDLCFVNQDGDSLESTPMCITVTEAPLDYISVENNEVTFQRHFTPSGKPDLCFVNQEGDSLESTPMSITVTEAPVDYKLSSVTWLPQYDDIQDQPVFAEDKSFQCCLKLKDVFNNDYEGSIPKDSIQLEYNNREVDNLNVSSCSEETGCYKIVVPLKNLQVRGPIPTFWCIVNGIRVENPLVLPTFTEFNEYDEKGNCTLEGLNIVCRGVTVKDITESLENIKRVCQLKRVPQVHSVKDIPIGLSVRLSSCDVEDMTPEEEVSKTEECLVILLHFLRAIYYRQMAFDLDNDREEWKARATENYEIGKVGERAHFCSQVKEKYAKLMKAYHNAACQQYFLFFNAERDQNTIDLHGLLVVNEKKLKKYYKRLRSKVDMTPEQVDRKINKEWNHGNEAIRYGTTIS